MPYCTATDVYRKAGISSTEITEANVNEFILDAEVEVDRITLTTHWKPEITSTATSATATTLVDTGQAMTDDAYIGDYVWIYGGTGSGQLQEITDNDATSLTVASWDTEPDSTSNYRIIHTGTNPYLTEQFVGSGTPYRYTSVYPIRLIESVTINDVTQTVASVLVNNDVGQLILGTDQGNGTATVTSRWDPRYDRRNTVVFWYGVFPFERLTARLTATVAAIMTLSAQIGGTFNDPTAYTFPEASIGLGEPYTNIRETIKNLRDELKMLTDIIVKYPTVFADDEPSTVSIVNAFR